MQMEFMQTEPGQMDPGQLEPGQTHPFRALDGGEFGRVSGGACESALREPVPPNPALPERPFEMPFPSWPEPPTGYPQV